MQTAVNRRMVSVSISPRYLFIGAGRLLPALVCGTICLCGPAIMAAVPKGVFSLSTAGKPCAESVLQNLNVDGISIRQDWADIEPSEGVFDWSFLDSEVARAAAAGKKVLLRIKTQSGKPAWVTDAVSAAGGTFYTFEEDGVQVTIPVFWDPTFLAKKEALIAAAGAHFTGNTAITIVAASFANANSEDWSVPHTPDEVAAWLAVGYTTDKLLAAGKEIIDATMAAFPNQLVTLAVAADGTLDADPNYAARNAILTARTTWPGRLIVQKNSLGTFNPPAPGTGTTFEILWDSRPDVAGQMLWNCFSDPTYRMNQGVPDDPAAILHESVNAGYSYGMDYLEIYQTDVVNLPAEIAYAHNLLLGLIDPSGVLPPLNVPAAPTGLMIVP